MQLCRQITAWWRARRIRPHRSESSQEVVGRIIRAPARLGKVISIFVEICEDLYVELLPVTPTGQINNV